MKILTLRNSMDGDAAILNGELLELKIKDECAEFIDIYSNRLLRRTTKIVYQDIGDEYVTIVTESGRIYELIVVTDIFPTTEENPLDTFIISKVEVLSDVRDFQPINYGDGYDKHEFTFNVEMTRDQFIEWLKYNNYKVRDKGAWYNDYSIISGAGVSWEYKWVRVYTD